MSKIIKKSDITNLVESTMIQAGILKEDDVETTEIVDENEELTEVDEVEEGEELDVVAESTKRLANDASEHNVISENLKKDLNSFNKIINYKY